MNSSKALFLASFSISLLLGSATLATPSDENSARAVCLVVDEPEDEPETDSNNASQTQPGSPANSAEPAPESIFSQPGAQTDTAPQPQNAIESNDFSPAPFDRQLPLIPPAAIDPNETTNNNAGDTTTDPTINSQSPTPDTSNETTSESDTPPDSPPPSSSPTPSIQVNTVEIVGSTVFNSDQFAPITQSLQGRSFSPQQLAQVAAQAADRITELYVQEGYITSFAEVEDASLASGTVRIQVIEGRIAEIRISGLRRLNPDYVCSRLRLATEAPVNANRLEEKLRLLKIDPLFETVEAILQRPDETLDAQQDNRRGQSVLRILVAEADPIELEISFDNHLPSTIAPQQLSAGIRHRNLRGFGDEAAFSYSVGVNVTDFPRAALNLYDLTYRLPLNPREGALQLRAVYSESAVTDEEFEQFGFRGTAEFYEIVYRQPIVRSLREEFALSAGFTLQNSQTFIFENDPDPFEFGPDEDGFSRTRILRFGQDYVRRDRRGAWGAQSQFSFGLDIFDATANPGSIPDGQFFSWLAQVARFQELGNDYRLIVRSGLQLTPDPLLSSQQFFLGGASSLRGYPPNSRRGDNGLFLAVESRIPIFRNSLGAPTFQLAPFAELGYVWNDPANPNPLPDQTFLSDVGLSLLFQPNDNLLLQLDLALPLVDFDDRRNNLQDNGIYFNANYNF